MDLLRLGRLSLFCQTIDRSESGVYEPSTDTWNVLPQCMNPDFAGVIAMARDPRKAMDDARMELDSTRKRAAAVKADALGTKEQITCRIDRLEQQIAVLEKKITADTAHILFLQEQNLEFEQQSLADNTVMDELSGAIRTSAMDLKALLQSSMHTALKPDRLDRLTPILDTGRMPGIDDLAVMVGLYLEEARLTGGIDLNETTYVSGTGETVTGEVLTIGGFTAAWRLGGTVGFLKYSADSRQLSALPAPPSRSHRKALNRYMNGESDSVPVDISRGEALRQLTHRQTLKNQVERGGVLIWPILALGVFAIFIGIERTLFLGRVHANTDKVMGQVNALAAKGEWEQCHAIVGKKKIPG